MKNSFFNPNLRLLLVRRIRLNAREWASPNLAAPYWRWYWNAQLGATVVLAGRETPLRPDQFMLIPPDTPFRGRVTGLPHHLYCHFLADPPYDAAPPAVYVFPARPLGLGLARRLAVLRDEPATLRERSLLALTLVHGALTQVPESVLAAPPDDPHILRVLRHLQDRSAWPVANEAMARVAGMSTNAFIRLFRMRTGLTPQAYHTRKRIEHACLELHGGWLAIEEIALRAGFRDRYHFSRVFKRLRGIGPAAFRRQSGGGRADAPA
ncbi:MAG: AraC family transcriptional regulator [Lentisphaeria bacterium]